MSQRELIFTSKPSPLHALFPLISRSFPRVAQETVFTAAVGFGLASDFSDKSISCRKGQKTAPDWSQMTNTLEFWCCVAPTARVCSKRFLTRRQPSPQRQKASRLSVSPGWLSPPVPLLSSEPIVYALGAPPRNIRNFLFCIYTTPPTHPLACDTNVPSSPTSTPDSTLHLCLCPTSSPTLFVCLFRRTSLVQSPNYIF